MKSVIIITITFVCMIGFIIPVTYADHWDVCTEIEFDGNNKDQIRNCWDNAEKQHEYQEEHLKETNARHSVTYTYQAIALVAAIAICSVIVIIVTKFVLLKKK
jgi:hypothetical protein